MDPIGSCDEHCYVKQAHYTSDASVAPDGKLPNQLDGRPRFLPGAQPVRSRRKLQDELAAQQNYFGAVQERESNTLQSNGMLAYPEAEQNIGAAFGGFSYGDQEQNLGPDPNTWGSRLSNGWNNDPGPSATAQGHNDDDDGWGFGEVDNYDTTMGYDATTGMPKTSGIGGAYNGANELFGDTKTGLKQCASCPQRRECWKQACCRPGWDAYKIISQYSDCVTSERTFDLRHYTLDGCPGGTFVDGVFVPDGTTVDVGKYCYQCAGQQTRYAAFHLMRRDQQSVGFAFDADVAQHRNLKNYAAIQLGHPDYTFFRGSTFASGRWPTEIAQSTYKEVVDMDAYQKTSTLLGMGYVDDNGAGTDGGITQFNFYCMRDEPNVPGNVLEHVPQDAPNDAWDALGPAARGFPGHSCAAYEDDIHDRWIDLQGRDIPNDPAVWGLRRRLDEQPEPMSMPQPESEDVPLPQSSPDPVPTPDKKRKMSHKTNNPSQSTFYQCFCIGEEAGTGGAGGSEYIYNDEKIWRGIPIASLGGVTNDFVLSRLVTGAGDTNTGITWNRDQYGGYWSYDIDNPDTTFGEASEYPNNGRRLDPKEAPRTTGTGMAGGPIRRLYQPPPDAEGGGRRPPDARVYAGAMGLEPLKKGTMLPDSDDKAVKMALVEKFAPFQFFDPRHVKFRRRRASFSLLVDLAILSGEIANSSGASAYYGENVTFAIMDYDLEIQLWTPPGGPSAESQGAVALAAAQAVLSPSDNASAWASAVGARVTYVPFPPVLETAPLVPPLRRPRRRRSRRRHPRRRRPLRRRFRPRRHRRHHRHRRRRRCRHHVRHRRCRRHPAAAALAAAALAAALAAAAAATGHFL